MIRKSFLWAALSAGVVLLCFSVFSCKRQSSASRFTKNNGPTVDSVLDSIVSEPAAQTSVSDTAEKIDRNEEDLKQRWKESFLADERKIDLDLTTMDSNMVYSEVYKMLIYPEDYIGKIVKMRGQFSSYHDEYSGNTYFACIIQDALACCSSGLEFSLKDNSYEYPKDFPVEGENITVIGRFSTYLDDDIQYLSLSDSVFM
ncbi:hypothetical protein DYE49_11340 [Treponema rectale]|uniref:Uncharacterized protein n=1 Tax=Treponema rectale TaxID=744512 RepID=A0A840SEC7_9SPIR|nr:hypothetical protein [Treponema rectale]MBB5219090.1 hypothetical protein [Treponema rectale]QOS41008.1 hypothetical protein DYE49_11340 [Treponema rectale]